MYSKSVQTLKSTQKIVRVMELSALGNLKKVRKRAKDAQEYFEAVYLGMKQLEHLLDTFTEQLAPDGRTLNIVITSNKGFCGSYNKSIFEEIDKMQPDAFHDFVVVGKQGNQYLKNKKFNVIDFIDDEISQIDAAYISRFLTQYVPQILEKKYIAVNVIYTMYLSPVRFETRNTQVFPQIQNFYVNEEKLHNHHFLEYDEKDEYVIENVIGNYLFAVLYSCLMLSYASEISLRRITMAEAKKNLDERIAELIYVEKKKMRVADISELIEIVSSSRTLKRGE